MLEEEKLGQMLKEEDQLRGFLGNLFKCPFCDFHMVPPSPIYQCSDGHILCHQCRHSAKLKVGRTLGRNVVNIDLTCRTAPAVTGTSLVVMSPWRGLPLWSSLKVGLRVELRVEPSPQPLLLLLQSDWIAISALYLRYFRQYTCQLCATDVVISILQ